MTGPRISEKALQLLEKMSGEEDDEFGYTRELAYSKDCWMLGIKRIPKRLVDELIYFCCIRPDSFSKDSGQYWAINGTGKDMLVSPDKTSQQINALLGRARPTDAC
jgi:hypothetical protein